MDATRRISPSPRLWAASIIAFVVIVLLLTLTAVTLISQRQRTVLLNKQLGALLDEATLVLKRAGPALDAVPARSTTIEGRARAAARLVAGLNASHLPGTVSATGKLLESIDQPGALAHTLASVDEFATTADQTGMVSRLVSVLNAFPAATRLISELTSLAASANRDDLITRSLDGLKDLDTLVHLQAHTLAIQKATLQNGRSTRRLTADAVASARQALAVARRALHVARQTLIHAANIDRKTGPAPPAGLP